MTIETATKLREAAALIGENGHAIGNFEDSVGRLCLQGALSKAYYGDADRMMEFEHYGTMRALEAVLPDRCSKHAVRSGGVLELEGNDIVYHFNDEHCDGAEEAMKVLIQAAEKLEAEL